VYSLETYSKTNNISMKHNLVLCNQDVFKTFNLQKCCYECITLHFSYCLHCDKLCIILIGSGIFFCCCKVCCAVTKRRCVRWDRLLALWCWCRMILKRLLKCELTTTCSTSMFIWVNIKSWIQNWYTCTCVWCAGWVLIVSQM